MLIQPTTNSQHSSALHPDSRQHTPGEESRRLREASTADSPVLSAPFPADFLLSVVIPVFNEEETVQEIVRRVRATRIPCEIIVVDDGSDDGTSEILSRVATAKDVRLISHATNQGKGAAVRTGCSVAEGSCVLIQDADLEYNPRDYYRLVAPILDGRADVVYGSRFAETDSRQKAGWHRWGNRMITWLSNRRTHLQLTDVETCYKVLRRQIADDVIPGLHENGFGIEIELTSKLAKRQTRIVEVPIRYTARSYAEGKKIGIRDALRAVWCVLRY